MLKMFSKNKKLSFIKKFFRKIDFLLFHFLYKYSSISVFSLILKLRLKNVVSPILPLMKLAGVVAPFIQPIDNSALLKTEEVRVSF